MKVQWFRLFRGFFFLSRCFFAVFFIFFVHVFISTPLSTVISFFFHFFFLSSTTRKSSDSIFSWACFLNLSVFCGFLYPRPRLFLLINLLCQSLCFFFYCFSFKFTKVQRFSLFQRVDFLYLTLFCDFSVIFSLASVSSSLCASSVHCYVFYFLFLLQLHDSLVIQSSAMVVFPYMFFSSFNLCLFLPSAYLSLSILSD